MGQLLNTRTCRKCGVELIVGNNWSKGASLKPDCICRSCKTAASRKWVEANPERAAATKAAWTEANRDRLKQLSRNWQEQNREKTRVSSAKWRDANPEKRKATTARYRAANPDRELINAANRRARLRSALHPDRCDLKIAAMYRLAAFLTARFATPYHVDHVVPLSKGGLHHQDNLVVMRGDYNCAKGAKIIPDLKAFFCPHEPL